MQHVLAFAMVTISDLQAAPVNASVQRIIAWKNVAAHTESNNNTIKASRSWSPASERPVGMFKQSWIAGADWPRCPYDSAQRFPCQDSSCYPLQDLAEVLSRVQYRPAATP
jgi:hypothetical protein